jgi:hypothetical protein
VPLEANIKYMKYAIGAVKASIIHIRLLCEIAQLRPAKFRIFINQLSPHSYDDLI